MNKFIGVSLAALLLSACGGDKASEATAEQSSQAKTTQTEMTQAQAATATTSQASTQSNAATLEELTKWDVDEDALIQEARSVIKAYGGTLKGELQKAMKKGGPVNALEVCHTRAPEIATAISAEKGMQIARVSLKNRNAVMGTANDWQTTVLQHFEERKAAGESPEQIAYAEVLSHNGQLEFRYMKAIATGKVCLKCHGTNIAPEVMSRLNELYPDDKAVGFSKGDLRGAFVVVKSIKQ